MADSDDKTESATPRRLSRAREEGNVAVSRELPPLLTLLVLWVTLAMMAPAMTQDFFDSLAGFFANIHRVDLSDGGGAVFRMAMMTSARVVLPIGLAALGASVTVTLLQTGFLFVPTKLQPDFSRLDPQRGLKRLFSAHSLVEAAKSIVKVAVIAGACWHVLATRLPQLQQSIYWLPSGLIARTAGVVLDIVVTMVAAQAVVAAADLLWVRYRHARDLRMTRSEVRQDTKDTEGDPLIRRRLRQIRTMRARRRMREAVKRATVVVANPTHYAVALRYERARTAAPVVVAKGMDSMAARIREAAAEFGVPVVVNPPLARALHQVELDCDIPPELYKAVAELIAYVWRLSRRHGQPRAAEAVR